MTYSYTSTSTVSFTVTEARRLASKVVTDMARCSQIYGRPSIQEIQEYGDELTLLLKDGYVHNYEFGFKNDERRVISWSYSVDVTGLSSMMRGRAACCPVSMFPLQSGLTF
jgi:hypothetical protein